MSPHEQVFRLHHTRLLLDIIEALTRRGEDYTDGECLDEVWALLERGGYGPELERSLERSEATKH